MAGRGQTAGDVDHSYLTAFLDPDLECHLQEELLPEVQQEVGRRQAGHPPGQSFLVRDGSGQVCGRCGLAWRAPPLPPGARLLLCKDAPSPAATLTRRARGSQPDLPTFLPTGARLGRFPGDPGHPLQPAPHLLLPYHSDSDKMSDVLAEDLERGSAVVAALVVTLITLWFLGTMITMISITMSVSGDYQGRVIAHDLCKSFPNWSFIGGTESSRCDQKIFNYHFSTETHCSCFLQQPTTKSL